jgi:hypothetical protein
METAYIQELLLRAFGTAVATVRTVLLSGGCRCYWRTVGHSLDFCQTELSNWLLFDALGSSVYQCYYT